jgi:hypothetical protein
MSQRYDPLGDRETRTDLHAAVHARRELGPEMEDQVIEAFLARIDMRVQAQVSQQLSEAKPVKARSKYNPTEIVGTSFGVAIPLMIIAGYFGTKLGVAAVVLLVFLVNVLYAYENRH